MDKTTKENTENKNKKLKDGNDFLSETQQNSDQPGTSRKSIIISDDNDGGRKKKNKKKEKQKKKKRKTTFPEIEQCCDQPGTSRKPGKNTKNQSTETEDNNRYKKRHFTLPLPRLSSIQRRTSWKSVEGTDGDYETKNKKTDEDLENKKGKPGNTKLQAQTTVEPSRKSVLVINDIDSDDIIFSPEDSLDSFDDDLQDNNHRKSTSVHKVDSVPQPQPPGRRRFNLPEFLSQRRSRTFSKLPLEDYEIEEDDEEGEDALKHQSKSQSARRKGAQRPYSSRLYRTVLRKTGLDRVRRRVKKFIIKKYIIYWLRKKKRKLIKKLMAIGTVLTNSDNRVVRILFIGMMAGIFIYWKTQQNVSDIDVPPKSIKKRS